MQKKCWTSHSAEQQQEKLQQIWRQAAAVRAANCKHKQPTNLCIYV